MYVYVRLVQCIVCATLMQIYVFVGFMLNLCAVLLEFFLPISSDNEKLLKVDLSYSSSSACRLNYDFETCLAGGQIGMIILCACKILLMKGR